MLKSLQRHWETGKQTGKSAARQIGMSALRGEGLYTRLVYKACKTIFFSGLYDLVEPCITL